MCAAYLESNAFSAELIMPSKPSSNGKCDIIQPQPNRCSFSLDRVNASILKDSSDKLLILLIIGSIRENVKNITFQVRMWKRLI